MPGRTWPEEPIEIVVSAFGPKAAKVAAESGDGMWMTGPQPEALDAYLEAGGDGPRIGQLTICWAESKRRP